MLINVNGMYYVHVCEQVHWTYSVGSNAIENVLLLAVVVKYLHVSAFDHQELATLIINSDEI